ncbi:hypothetical protein GmHk_14G040856 [Glycine max]|nr:hypothetical protein GmHk_14G040856 [Glycine max]
MFYGLVAASSVSLPVRRHYVIVVAGSLLHHHHRCLITALLSKQESSPVWVSSLKPTVWASSLNLVMERSSSSYTSEARSHVMCLCNIEAPLVTSWTEYNLGRHFYAFGQYKVTGRKECNYFEWHDPVANSLQKRIIVALMKKVDELNLREKDLQTKISDMKMKGNFLGI